MKGVTQLYDAVESLLREVKDYVERVGIHLEPPTMPNPAVMRILLDTLVQILKVLGIVTKYCDRAVERQSWLKKAGDVVSLRTSQSSCIHLIVGVLLTSYAKRITSESWLERRMYRMHSRG